MRVWIRRRSDALRPAPIWIVVLAASSEQAPPQVTIQGRLRCGDRQSRSREAVSFVKDDETILGSNEAISPTQENIRKQTPDTIAIDQTTGFDRVGIHQLALSPLLPVEFGWNAQASPCWMTGKLHERSEANCRAVCLGVHINCLCDLGHNGIAASNLDPAKHRYAGPP